MADSYLVQNNWNDDPNSIIGKLEIAPGQSAQAMWEVVKKMPHLFQFGISYIENSDGTFELIGISLIRAFPNPLRNLDTPPK